MDSGFFCPELAGADYIMSEHGLTVVNSYLSGIAVVSEFTCLYIRSNGS